MRGPTTVLALVVAAALGGGVIYAERSHLPPPAGAPAPAPSAQAAPNTATAAPAPIVPEGAASISLAPIVDRVTPAVVNVAVKSRANAEVAENPLFQDPLFRRFFGAPEQAQPQERMAVGSGVIIDADKGYVVTNFHVVNNATDISVTLKDRRTFTAKVIGKDQDTDVALLQIDAKGLTALPVGDSSKLRVGDYVIAVGNPFGLGQTVTSGIVSALGRSGLNIEGYEDFIQTDASINPGNSGGALVNLKGELIGINTAIVGPSGGNVGIGFAVPTSMVSGVVEQLAQNGKVSRGRIGVAIQDLTPELAKNLGVDDSQQGGAVVSRVESGTPADRAGVKTGDVITAINHTPVTGSAGVRNRIGLVKPGTSVTLSIMRKGASRDIDVKVGEVQQAKAEGPASTKAQASKLDGATLENARGGVRLADVEQGSPAWQMGLRPGDMITAVNRKPVRSVEELNTALNDSQGQTALFIRRGDEDLLLIV
jgi:Do/DeqQ family serine protease